MDQRLVTPLNKMQRAIQLAAFHYIVCLKATPTNDDHKLNIDKREYVFEGIRKAKSLELHVEFQSWAAVSVLRDLIESFSIFLMEVYEVALEKNPDADFSTTSKKFERRGIEDQLDILMKDFSVDAAWVSRLVGFNRARNCLAHRAGVVGAPDLVENNELVVRWLDAEIALHDGLDSNKMDMSNSMSSLIQGQHQGGAPARFTVKDREKRIPLGNFLEFLPDEILEICSTFQLASAAFSNLSRPLARQTTGLRE